MSNINSFVGILKWWLAISSMHGLNTFLLNIIMDALQLYNITVNFEKSESLLQNLYDWHQFIFKARDKSNG